MLLMRAENKMNSERASTRCHVMFYSASNLPICVQERCYMKLLDFTKEGVEHEGKKRPEDKVQREALAFSKSSRPATFTTA